jgi:hypothetical protein
LDTIISWHTTIARRQVLLGLGGFDEDIHQSEDWDLQLRVAARHDIVGVAEPVALVRQHERPLITFAEWRRRQRECARVEWRGAMMPTRQRVPVARRILGRRRLRGRSAYEALVLARRTLEAGHVAEARRFVLGAARRSLPHTVKLVPQFRAELWAMRPRRSTTAAL